MKKNHFIYIYSIFIFIFTCVFFVAGINEATVTASYQGSCSTTDGVVTIDGSEGCITTEKIGMDTIGTIKISKGGQINVTYKYGITELLIYAQTCQSYEYKNGIASCGSYGEEKVIHGSGAKSGGSQTVNLNKYFRLGTAVRVRMIYEFIKSETDKVAYTAVYCNFSINSEECKEVTNENPTINKADYKLSSRISGISVDGKNLSSSTYVTLDSRGVVLALNGDRGSVPTQRDSYENEYIKPIIVISNKKVKESGGEVSNMINDTILPVLQLPR